MLCDRCKQNEASVHIQEVIGVPKQQSTVLHLCAECAAAQGLLPGSAGDIDLAAIVQNFASGVLAPVAAVAVSEDTESSPSVQCPECGLSRKEFRHTGRLGCANCYETFADILAPLLEGIHVGVQHVGRKPGEPESDSCGPPPVVCSGLTALQRDLERAISAEAFEDAARLRDQILCLQQTQEDSRSL